MIEQLNTATTTVKRALPRVLLSVSLAGTAAVGVGVGVGAELAQRSDEASADAYESKGDGVRAELLSKSADTYDTMGDIALGGAVADVAATAGLYLMARRRRTGFTPQANGHHTSVPAFQHHN